MAYTVLTINPGSTSTKIGVVRDREILLDTTIDYHKEDFPGCETVRDQIPLRIRQILTCLKDAGIDPSELDGISARGVSLHPCEGGTYEINQAAYNDSWNNIIHLEHHPAVFAVCIGKDMADQLGIPAFFVDPMPMDELADVARMTGMKGIYRPAHAHPLNMKQVARMHSEKLGRPFEESNYVVLHLGGGISIGAMERSRLVDCTRSGDCQSPIQPNRCGDFSVDDFRSFLKERNLTAEEGFRKVISIKGGFLDMLGTDDLRKVKEMIRSGNRYAKLCYDAMEYSIVKWASTMAGVLKGRVDGVLVTGGMAKDPELTQRLDEDLSWIAPVTVYPGSFETEALGFGAVRVLEGRETAKTYTGQPVFTGFEYN